VFVVVIRVCDRANAPRTCTNFQVSRILKTSKWGEAAVDSLRELGGIATAVFAELVQQLIHVVFRKVFPTSFLIIERFTRKQSEKAQSFDRL
jgi:hypothetical protein